MFPKTVPNAVQLSETDRNKISLPSPTTTITNVRDFPTEVLDVRFDVVTAELMKTRVF
jgi:aspartate carbamoyltransferase regulatory subunit